MHYTLHQLLVFIKVAEKESITKAAEELFLTQPAVSIQMRKLQDQFDIPLTEVIGKKLFITDFGKEVLSASKRILEETEVLQSITDRHKGLLTGKIHFNIVSTAKYVMPYFLKEFTNAYPQIEVIIDVTNKKTVVKSLKDNSTDFALLSTLPEDLKLESTELMENKIILAGPSNSKQKMDLKTMKEKSFIFREDGSATRTIMENYFLNQNIEYKQKLELVSNEAIKQAIMAELGYSLMPVIGLKNELNDESIKICEAVELPIYTTWQLVHLTGKKLSPAALAYLEFLHEHKNEIIEKHFSWTKNY